MLQYILSKRSRLLKHVRGNMLRGATHECWCVCARL